MLRLHVIKNKNDMLKILEHICVGIAPPCLACKKTKYRMILRLPDVLEIKVILNIVLYLRNVIIWCVVNNISSTHTLRKMHHLVVCFIICVNFSTKKMALFEAICNVIEIVKFSYYH